MSFSELWIVLSGLAATVLAFARPLLHAVLAAWLCHGLYVLVMGFYRAKLNGTLTRTGYIVGYPWLLIGLVLDCLINMTVATFLFWELPREGLVTLRLQRYLKTLDNHSWRYELASFICTQTLDYFDPHGKHC